MEVIVVNREELKDLLEPCAVAPDHVIEEIFSTAREWGLTDELSQGPYVEFSKLYLAFRRSMHHKGLTLIKSDHHMWNILVKVADEAMAFNKENNLERRYGFKLFLTTAKDVSNSFRLTEILAKADKIHEYFVAKAIVDEDPHKDLTDRIYLEYQTKKIEVGEREENFKGKPLKYQYLVEAGDLALKYKVSAKEFIAIAFDEFAWYGVPQLYHLVGKKLETRLSRQNKIKFGEKKVKRYSLKDVVKK